MLYAAGGLALKTGQHVRVEVPAAANDDPAPDGDYGTCVPAGKQLHPLRRKAIELARSQVGLVNATKYERKGWERQAEYQKIGYPTCSLDPNNWQTKKNFEWCGVFCAWAGVTTKTWSEQGIPKGEKAPRNMKDMFPMRNLFPAGVRDAELPNITPGDVLILNEYYHHMLCAKRSGSEIVVIQGNGVCEAITEKSVSFGKMQAYFHVMDEDYV